VQNSPQLKKYKTTESPSIRMGFSALGDSPGGICVTQTENGQIEDKLFNPQISQITQIAMNEG
jgi:hypothetical protein